MNKAHANDKARTLIVWEVPAVGSPAFVEMYVNPSSLQFNERKLINPIRTKGGYLIQYWGAELTELTIRGQTGSGGIEALNVIKDIYLSEQIAVQKIITSQGPQSKRRQSLAQLSTQVIMWYQGQGYRGFFKSFDSTESIDKVGVFDYGLNFVVVELVGEPRKNFLPWQRKPWSTIENPSSDSGKGTTTGGAYGTNYKIGEMNAPAVSTQSGVLSDPEFTSDTGLSPSQKTLKNNLTENQTPIRPSDLFA